LLITTTKIVVVKLTFPTRYLCVYIYAHNACAYMYSYV
jgi:hypothetical protein